MPQDSEKNKTLVDAIREMTPQLKRIADCVCHGSHERSGGGSTAGSFEVPRDASSDFEREEVLIRYTVGTGEFSADKKYNVLKMRMFKLSGEADGTHDGVWEPMVPPGVDPHNPGALEDALRKRPQEPLPPLDKPEGPIDHIFIRAYTKAIWRFGDDSSVTAVGPANLHLVKFNDDSQIFLVSVAAIITNGTGKYEGAYGVKTALGSTSLPKGRGLFDLKRGETFEARTVETFRILRKKFLVKETAQHPKTRDEVY
jgi:hypothetical protein